MRHRTTDPACRYHRPIRGLFARWRDRCSRGRCCRACAMVTTVFRLRVDDAAWRTFKPGANA